MPFAPGQSGNPNGKPRGPRAKALEVLRAPLEKNAPAIIAKVIEMALSGDPAMLKLATDKLLPNFKALDPCIAIKGIGGETTITGKAGAIVDATVSGRLPPDLATALLNALASACKIIESQELADRIATLEEQVARQSAQ